MQFRPKTGGRAFALADRLFEFLDLKNDTSLLFCSGGQQGVLLPGVFGGRSKLLPKLSDGRIQVVERLIVHHTNMVCGRGTGGNPDNSFTWREAGGGSFRTRSRNRRRDVVPDPLQLGNPQQYRFRAAFCSLPQHRKHGCNQGQENRQESSHLDVTFAGRNENETELPCLH